MFTVQNLLALPQMRLAKLITQGTTLNHAIRRVHVVDMPNPTLAWARGGELLLTSGSHLQDNEAAQQHFIQQLVEKKLAGLVISTGVYLDDVPSALARTASRLNFPVIALPADVPFIDITEAIYDHILREQNALQKRGREIHRILTDVVLDGGSLKDVAIRLAGILECSITIESETFEVLATARHGPVDEARNRSVESGQTTPDLANQLLEMGIYDRLLHERTPQVVQPMPEIGMTLERIVAPIMVARQIVGYVWIIAGENGLDTLDKIAVEHAATVAALLMLKDSAVQDTHRSLRGDLFSELIGENMEITPEVVERAHRLNFPLDAQYQVLLVVSQVQAVERALFLSSRIEQALINNHPALVFPREDRVVITLWGKRRPQGKTIAHNLLDRLHHPTENLLIGVGNPIETVETLRESYRQANETVAIAQATGQDAGVILFQDLGLLHWLRHIPPEIQRENLYLDKVRLLDIYDDENQGELLATLETFLDTGNVSASAASKLSIHRNTLAYRLERIEELTHLSLKDPLTRLNLHVAIKNFRLNRN